MKDLAWRTRIIDRLLTLGPLARVNIANVYLVGSSVPEHPRRFSESDLDLLVIVGDNVCDTVLSELADETRHFLASRRTKVSVSCKVLTTGILNNMAVVDGFRLYEYQMYNEPYLNTDILHGFTPHLTVSTVWASAMIQVVYTYVSLGNDEEERFFYNVKKLRQRLQVCQYRLQALGKGQSVPSDLNTLVDHVRYVLRVLNGTKSPSMRVMGEIMAVYFARFRHEAVNKASPYLASLGRLVGESFPSDVRML